MRAVLCSIVPLLCIVLPISRTSAQGSAGSSSRFEPRYIVDMPTAGMLEQGTFALDIEFYEEGGVLAGISAGVFNRLSIGVSYGGSKLTGGDMPEMNDVPGVNLKVRLLEESIVLPAIAIGFDSQGRNGYLKSLNRYHFKSPGLYAAASKNYGILGFLSIHGGVNYSLERFDGDSDINFFAGIEKTIGPVISLVIEYNFATNDNSGNALGQGKGYLNGVLSWSVTGGLTLGVCFKDVLQNQREYSLADRTVRLEFAKSF